MRIIVRLNGTNELVPIVNQHLMNGYIHKCLGENNKYHNTKNDYSISSLYGGKQLADKSYLDFSNGGYFVVSTINSEFFGDLIIGITQNNVLFKGITVNGFDTIQEKFYDGLNHFATLSPFIIKKYIDKKQYTFAKLSDDDFESVVENHLKNKLSKILNAEVDLKVSIPKHNSHKVKKIMIKNCVNYANQCQVSISCDKKIAELIYNIGLGQSTGSGFGTIYKTENTKFYRN
jgi:CRISPR-associated endoribonuclease Cas6